MPRTSEFCRKEAFVPAARTRPYLKPRTFTRIASLNNLADGGKCPARPKLLERRSDPMELVGYEGLHPLPLLVTFLLRVCEQLIGHNNKSMYLISFIHLIGRRGDPPSVPAPAAKDEPVPSRYNAACLVDMVDRALS